MTGPLEETARRLFADAFPELTGWDYEQEAVKDVFRRHAEVAQGAVVDCSDALAAGRLVDLQKVREAAARSRRST